MLLRVASVCTVERRQGSLLRREYFYSVGSGPSEKAIVSGNSVRILPCFGKYRLYLNAFGFKARLSLVIKCTDTGISVPRTCKYFCVRLQLM
jgi:hypothetical protein